MLNATRKRSTLQSGSRVGVSSWKITTQKHVGRGRILAEGRPGPSNITSGIVDDEETDKIVRVIRYR